MSFAHAEFGQAIVLREWKDGKNWKFEVRACSEGFR